MDYVFWGFFFWIGFAVIVGIVANSRRGRSGFRWFLLALLISPLLAGLLVLALPNKDIVGQRFRKCPSCANLLKRDALVCNHCESTPIPAILEESAPPCSRCRHRTKFATILNVADHRTLYVRPPEYLFRCQQCKRVDSYYLKNRTAALSHSLCWSGPFVSTSTDI
jgi:hypothetical protein